MHEVVRIRFRNNPSLVRLLHKILVSLLLSKVYGIVPRCKVQVRALQVVRGRLPSHQRILPSVSLLQYVPVHAPVMTVPISRLRGCLGRPVYSVAVDISFGACCHLWEEVAYRTVRACRSTGAPDNTAAGVIPPSSLPSITRFGIGENCLQEAVRVALFEACRVDSRSSMVDGSMVIWLMVHHCLARVLLSYH